MGSWYDKTRKVKPVPWSSWQKAGGSILVGLVCGAAICITLHKTCNVYQRGIDRAQQSQELVSVVMPARLLRAAVKIHRDDLVLVPMPGNLVPAGAVTELSRVVGRYPKAKLLPEEPIREERLADPERGDGLHAVLPRGMRAIAVEVNRDSSVLSWVQPGDQLDVIGTWRQEEVPVTSTVLRKVMVLAVDKNHIQLTPQEQRETKVFARPVVTLLVDSEDALRVALAERTAGLDFAIRSDLDTSFTDRGRVTLTELLERKQMRGNQLARR